ncbi:MAG TPA: hypothetical protein VNK43_09400 [Gemmatimonadales bacterium]|nr:hypothetical protein [Gemmatimonadales bacterium]
MDLGTIAILLGLLVWVFGRIGEAGKARERRERMGQLRRRAEAAARRQPPGPARRPAPPPEAASTQEEGALLERILRGLEEPMQPPPTRRPGTVASTRPEPTVPDGGADGDEVVEEAETLEVEERVVNLDEVVRRPERPMVDLDAGAEETERRRVAAAAARDRPHARADHAAFDARIRQEPAEHTAAARRGYTARELRDAFVWREILGPPVALRAERD